MPEGPNWWVQLADKLPPHLAGVLLAVVIAALRVIYDKQETHPVRVALEAGICGGLSLTASSGIAAMGLDMNWAIAAGGVIGYLGSTTVKVIALRIIRRKIK